MHIRKQTIGRNMLRIFEIALFFAISVIGYGFMLKVSSSSTKSKSRDRDSIAFHSSLHNGLRRELRVLSSSLLFPHDTAATSLHGAASHAMIHPVPLLARHCRSGKDNTSHYLDDSRRLPRPCNLLEQNPILLN